VGKQEKVVRKYGQERSVDYLDIYGLGLGTVDIYGLGVNGVAFLKGYICAR